MHRPIQHVIDTKASCILRSVLPPEWTVTEIHPDYGKDYLVEIAESELMTGKLFIVQLKGTERLKIRKNGKVSFPLATKHLAYYNRCLPLPVFLVIVDANTGEAIYEFIQGMLKWRPSTELEWQVTNGAIRPCKQAGRCGPAHSCR